ncbi:transposase [Candidatus Tisiphia endosymbiont of Dioctria rufipes]|uniref:transposase n=1 Tax=Candidatus Tisiphia endosymbiont of Dioctria rufipes TaxID=3066255 RepID=UPI00397735CA
MSHNHILASFFSSFNSSFTSSILNYTLGLNNPKTCFADLYHGRWGIEELYKISKLFVNIEEFHGKTARGVKQELYAHLLLINLARFFEFEAKNLLPPYEKNESDAKNALDSNLSTGQRD